MRHRPLAVTQTRLRNGGLTQIKRLWIGLRWFGRCYRAHWFSDQSIMIDAVLLIFTIEYGLGLKEMALVHLISFT